MIFSSRISTGSLAGICRRVAISLGAGIDVRTVWAREAERATDRTTRWQIRAVAQAVNRGETLTDALAQTGNFFPALFRELVAVGEQTGHLSEVFSQLAEHYEGRLQLRRQFWADISWPLIQLGFTILLVGLLIAVTGMIRSSGDTSADVLKIGLVGNRGLLLYLGFLAVCGLSGWLIWEAIRRGLAWTAPIQRAALRLPAVGRALETLALARLAWALHLTFGTGLEVRRALRLSLGSAGNARYTDCIDRIDREISQGNSLSEAFLHAGVFPRSFLDALATAEQSGRVAEAMGLLAQQLHSQARIALAVLSRVGSFAVWLVVATVIVCLIFRLAFSYFGILRDALPT